MSADRLAAEVLDAAAALDDARTALRDAEVDVDERVRAVVLADEQLVLARRETEAAASLPPELPARKRR